MPRPWISQAPDVFKCALTAVLLASIRISNGSPLYYENYTKLHIVATVLHAPT